MSFPTPEEFAALAARIAARDGKAPQPAKPTAAKKSLPMCIHLGKPLAGEEKQPCGHRLTDCFMFEVCTWKPSDRAEHHCTDGRGNYVCEEYEPRP